MDTLPPNTSQTVPAAHPTPDTQESERRNGKVARLPKPIRDKLSTMILDGVPYSQIIRTLGKDTAHLNEQNLSNWKSGGYLEWLREFYITRAIQSKYEFAQAIVDKAGDENAAGHAVLESMALNLCEFLVQTDPSILREDLLSDSNKFTKFVNSMVRLAEGGVKCLVHKFNAQDRALKAATQPTKTERPGISDSSLHNAEDKLKLL